MTDWLHKITRLWSQGRVFYDRGGLIKLDAREGCTTKSGKAYGCVKTTGQLQVTPAEERGATLLVKWVESRGGCRTVLDFCHFIITAKTLADTFADGGVLEPTHGEVRCLAYIHTCIASRRYISVVCSRTSTCVCVWMCFVLLLIFNMPRMKPLKIHTIPVLFVFCFLSAGAS